ncbi:unnamed protein product, partial [Gulo gulo]
HITLTGEKHQGERTQWQSRVPQWGRGSAPKIGKWRRSPFARKVPVYNWSPQIQGIISSSLSYDLIPMMFLSGYLAGRVGTKRVVGVSLFATSLFTIFTPLVAELGLVSLIVTRIAQSNSQGSVLGGQHALWEKWGPPHE